MAELKRDWVVIDLETTGVIPGRDEIIEIAAVRINGTEITDTYQTLVKPSVKIPLRVKRLTGIDDEMVSDAPFIYEVLEPLANFIGDSIITGHNVRFDTSFLEVAFGMPMLNPVWDTLDLARLLYPAARNHRLENLSTVLELPHPESHRALGDCTATAHLLLKLMDKAARLEPKVINTINHFTSPTVWPYKSLFAGLEGKPKSNKPEQVDEGLFAQASGDKPELPEFSREAVGKFLSMEGQLAKAFENYEARPQQVKMSDAVSRALEEDKYLVVEADTGTGKSLAYLVPAIYWARSSGEKVVVTTHTINLQEQLIKKDIPTLAETLPFTFKAALVKGRGNYICLRRWQAKTRESGRWNEEELGFYLRVLVWLSETISGDKTELNLSGNQSDYWQELLAERESCLGTLCPWSRQCYLRKARKKAEEADVLIVNHSLVFADVNSGNKVLPDYQYLIIDEAHHLEEEATQHLGMEVSYQLVRRYLRTLFQGFGEKVSPGILSSLRTRFATVTPGEILGVGGEDFKAVLEKTIEKVFSAHEGNQVLFDILGDLIRGQGGGGEDYKVKVLRLKEEHLAASYWPQIEAARDNLSIRLLEIIEGLQKLCTALEGEDTGWDVEFTALVKELQSQIGSGRFLMDALNFLLAGIQENYVHWLEASEYNTTVKAAPIKIGPLVAQHIFQQKKSVILTSATISVDSSFEHFFERVGITAVPEERLMVERVESPFRYDLQSLLCLPNDLPNPGQVPEELYIQAITPFLEELIVSMGGKTLVLFTSHKMLRDVYSRLRENLEQKDICLQGHGIDGSRSRLMEDFKSGNRNVLFGASSFWEGVDLPGENLSCVVIVKLPFSAPNIPTVEARLEDLQKNGLNSFRHFTLPAAVIRLKQGFGRLIRTRQDQGIVVILDPRVIQLSYGKKFLGSLPVKSHIRGESGFILKKIAGWMGGERVSEDTLNLINSPGDVAKFLAKSKNRG